jgi:hypothetical protein
MATQAMSNALYFSTGSHAEEELGHYGEVLLTWSMSFKKYF